MLSKVSKPQIEDPSFPELLSIGPVRSSFSEIMNYLILAFIKEAGKKNGNTQGMIHLYQVPTCRRKSKAPT
jgi:hypothetical protein